MYFQYKQLNDASIFIKQMCMCICGNITCCDDDNDNKSDYFKIAVVKWGSK